MKVIDSLRSAISDLPSATRYAVYVYLAHILCQGKIALSEIALALTLVLVTIAVTRHELRPSFHILYFPLALYGIASTISAAVNHSRHSAGESALWLKMLIFPAALILFREVPRMREYALRTQIVFAVAIALDGIIQYFMESQRDLEHRITGPTAHVMTYSGFLLPTSLLLLMLAVRRRKTWLFACTAIVSFALLLTFTRSVWLGWLVAVFAVLLLNRSAWIVYAMAVLIFAITFMPEAMFGRLVSSFDIRQSSNLDRIRMAEAGMEMIKDHPVLGVGPANVKEIYPLYRKEDAPRFRPPHLHNNIIQLWAERGILAVVAYVMLLGLFIRECVRGWRGPAREFAEAGVAITVGLAYAGLFEFNFGDTEVFLIMLELFALVIASIEAAQPATNERPFSVVPPPSAALPAAS
jgi:O-antigen ligase